ncbi:GNAT family N-acetyltransferase [Streptomyces taklimakanensis]|uniref:GNAT family N-acetyltransferase n=1 Tax=Streptomyces taklimakanensis TaxID=2569853 RepID=UPI0012BA64C0
MTSPNVLITARLALRELPPDGIRSVLAGRPGTGVRWAEGYPSQETLGALVRVGRSLLADAYRPGFGLYQIVWRGSGETVGDVVFHAAPDDDGSVEIGYAVVEAYRGRGIAGEAVRALTAWALERPGVTEVRAETDAGNPASRRVLRGAGFRPVGDTDGTFRFVLTRASSGPHRPTPPPRPAPTPPSRHRSA